MNKKVLAALVSTLAFGTVTVAQAGEPAAEKPAKAEKAPKGDKAKKGDKKDDKKGGEKSCSGDKKGGEKSCSGDKKGGEKSCGAK